jgi:transposase
MTHSDGLSCSSVALEQDSTLVAVIEMSLSSWLVAGLAPGLKREPLKKIQPDKRKLLGLLQRWRDEAEKAGYPIKRIVAAYEAGRDGFWLARWLRKQGVECYVIHAASIAVSREHRRAKSDRLDTELLMRALLGWLRGERRHCRMVAIPSTEEENARRPSREREALIDERTRFLNRIKSLMILHGIRGFKPGLRGAAERLETLRTEEGAPLLPDSLAELRRLLGRLRVIGEQVEEIETARRVRLEQQPEQGTLAMVPYLAQIYGLGIETAHILVFEMLSRSFPDRRAVARFAGLTGAPDESGARRREKGLAKGGNARVRRIMVQFAWRFLRFQEASALAQWYRQRTEGAQTRRKTMIVALARKLLIALWRFATTGVVPEGVTLRRCA